MAALGLLVNKTPSPDFSAPLRLNESLMPANNHSSFLYKQYSIKHNILKIFSIPKEKYLCKARYFLIKKI